MAKLILLCFLAIFCFASTSDASTYIVGDTSGWDISTDLDAWASGKVFKVGDVLLFQYSSYNSICEVTHENYESCNTTDPLTAFSNGNTTVTLSKPGPIYFVCCNQLRCLGGMKLEVDVSGNQATSTVAAPEAQPGATLPQPASKSNNPSTAIPTSSGFAVGGTGSLVLAFASLMATMLILAKI